MTEKMYDISVVIPAKDEADRLPRFLKQLIAYINLSTYRYEVIIVDDGSEDDTAEKCLMLHMNHPFIRVMKLRENRGKGMAVKQGLKHARGEFALFMDADGSTPPEAIEENLKYFNQGFDIIIGSRVLKDEHHIVETKAYRTWMGRFFNLFVRGLLLPEIHDSQCGFKMFRSHIIPSLFDHVTIDGFGFDLQLLYEADRLGYTIKETPVSWHHVEDSKIHLFRDSFRMLNNIFQIRFSAPKQKPFNPKDLQELTTPPTKPTRPSQKEIL